MNSRKKKLIIHFIQNCEALYIYKGITEEQSSSSANLVSVNKSSPTNSSEMSKPHCNISDSDIIIDIESNIPLDASSTLSSSVNRKRIKRCSKSSNKDRCPCLTSDATSWKPKCCNCKQTWHTACCNLRGIPSITELENWECPWCYVPLFSDPTKPKAVLNELKSIKINVGSIQDKFNQFNVTDLQKQINDLQENLKIMTVTQPSTQYDSINTIHDDILKSINFELQKQATLHESVISHDISEIKKSLNEMNSINTNRVTNNVAPQVLSAQKFSHNFPGKHYNHHKHSFLPSDCKLNLESFIEANDTNFIKVGNREVLYYGDFGYKYGNMEHQPSPAPEVIQKIIDQIHNQFPLSSKVNSCLLTKYPDGSSICPAHGDDEPFIGPCSDIFTLSVGAERSMKFENSTNKAANAPEDNVSLKDNDLLVFTRASQDFYHHSIEADDSINQPRYSLTFRHLTPYNLNYTVIIGDSNTKNLVFGADQGKLGMWMPGCRIKASKISNIPDPHSIGPCRNILFNVGINDVQGENPKSAKLLASLLDSKIKAYLAVYPKTKIYISLLLPTKDISLNYCVNELNKCIKFFAANSNNIFIVEHNNLVDQYGFLDPLLGRFKRSIPNTDDLIHLGPSGLKRFVRNFKDLILHKKSSSSNRRHNSSLPLPRTTETPHLTPQSWQTQQISGRKFGKNEEIFGI